MKLDASAIHYLIAREFEDVVAYNISRSGLFDYPILYDGTSNMSGHSIIMPDHERPVAGPNIEGVLFVCLGEASTKWVSDQGFPVIYVHDATFQRLYNYMQELFVRNERMDAQLRAYVDAFAGFQPLLDVCEQATECPCALIDDRFRSVCQSSSVCGSARAASGDARADVLDGASAGAHSEVSTGIHAEMLESDAVDMFMASSGYRYMRKSRNVFTMPGSNDLFMKNVFADGKLVGTLVARHEGDVISARYIRFLLGYLCSFVEEMYMRIGSFGMSSTKPGIVRSALSDYLSGDPTGATRLEGALVDDGHRVGCSYVIARIERRFTNEGIEGNDHLARRFELSWPRAYCFIDGGALYMLANVDEGPQNGMHGFLRVISTVARDNLSKIGVSRLFSSMENLRMALVQATAAIEQGGEIDPMLWCYRFNDYALTWLVSRARGDAAPECLCHPALAALDRYDADHGSDLFLTLAVFMRCRYNATEAAHELFVARSTLLNRLERIVGLTGIDLDDPEERAYLILSFALIVREKKPSRALFQDAFDGYR